GPIFRVEMVSTARRKRYFALRVLYAALILLVLWTSYESTSFSRSFGNPGTSIQQGTMLATTFFVSFSWLQMLTILTVGPALAVGTIAAERERRTIEYLFATDLANHEIVLGKTVARLMLLGKLVLVGLPILFLFRLLGGIPTKLLLTTFLLAGSSAVMITALSLCVSVWSSRARDATVRVYLLLAALFFLPMILEEVVRIRIAENPLWQMVVAPAVDACLVINPMWALGWAAACSCCWPRGRPDWSLPKRSATAGCRCWPRPCRGARS
ncbi:MAG: ABC transporter permease, partial [Planctomycetes bacterium]|nr:ABC transporter permease [Planctomycetota bacterium]